MGSARKFAAIVHAGLVFPRNETYEPGDLMPIIFGFDQSNFNNVLHPQIQYTLGGDGTDQTEPAVRLDATTNAMEDSNHNTLLMPFWTDKFTKEGHYKISWTINVQQCASNFTDPRTLQHNGSKPLEFNAPADEALAVYFTVQAGGLARNLSSIHSESCHAGPGAAFNVTNLALNSMELEPISSSPSCVEYDNEHPFSSSSSCNIIVDPSMDDRMNYFFRSHYLQAYCNLPNPPKSLQCPTNKNMAVRTVGSGISIMMFAALLSVFCFIHLKAV